MPPRYIESSEVNADSSGTGGNNLGVNKSETFDLLVSTETGTNLSLFNAKMIFTLKWFQCVHKIIKIGL